MNMEVMSLQPTLNATRFDLRPLRHSDVGPLEMHMGDARVAKMTRTFPHPLPPGTAASFVERALDPERNEDLWVMDGSRHGMGEVLGGIGLERMDRDQSEVGFWVVPGLWGTGIATEAVETLLRANPLGSETIFAAVFQDNPASARVLTNLGFQYIGDAEYHAVARNALVPTWTYSLSMR